MTAAEHKSDFELTKDPVTRASYGVFVVGIWGKLHPHNTITLYMNILKHSSPRPNDAWVSYITIRWDNDSSLAWHQAII